MVKPPASRAKGIIIVVAATAIAVVILLPAFNSSARKAPGNKSLSNAKRLLLACKEYSVDHAGNFPPSLDALIPSYIDSQSLHSILVSPYNRNEQIGYSYTRPELKETDSADTIVIEDRFAPSVGHGRIVVYANGSSRVIDRRTPLRAFMDHFSGS